MNFDIDIHNVNMDIHKVNLDIHIFIRTSIMQI